MIERKINNIHFITGKWPLIPNQPTLIFIHGSGGSNILWESQVEKLSEHVNTIALNLPGHGKSSGSGMHSVRDYAEVVSSFIHDINPPLPVLCGVSIGGAIVLDLLLEDKTRYKAGVLINTGARLKVMPLIFETIKKDYSAYISSLKMFAASEKTDPSILEPLLKDSALCNPEVTYGDFEACDAFDVMDKLEDIAVPVLVLTAKDDKLTPPKYGAFLSEKITNSFSENIMDAGHMSPVEKPEEVNYAIIKFLKAANILMTEV